MYCPKCKVVRKANYVENGKCLDCNTQVLNISAEDIIETLAHFGNISAEQDIAEIMAHKLMRTHRTLQQSVFRAIQSLAKHYTELSKTFGCDMRNQSAVHFAKDIVKIDAYLPRI